MSKTIAFAILFGLAAIVPVALAARIHNIAIAVSLTAVIYIAAGSLFGWLRQSVNGLWGLLIAAPMMALLILSVVFSGIFTRFWDTDVPLIISALVAPCIGIAIGSRLSRSPDLA